MNANATEILISGFKCRTIKQTDKWRNSRCGKPALFAHLVSRDHDEYEPVCGRHAAMYRNQSQRYATVGVSPVVDHRVVVDLMAQIGAPPFTEWVVRIIRQMRTDVGRRNRDAEKQRAASAIDATRAQTVRVERKWQERAITYTVAETTNPESWGPSRTEWVVSGAGGQAMTTVYLTSEDNEPDEINVTGHLVPTTPSFARAFAEALRMAASRADRQTPPDAELAAARRWADSTRD